MEPGRRLAVWSGVERRVHARIDPRRSTCQISENRSRFLRRRTVDQEVSMSTPRAAALGLLLVTLTLPTPAASSFWLHPHGDGSLYRMGDLNEEIRQVNAAIHPLSMDEVKRGLAAGVELGLPTGSPTLDVSVDYTYMMGSTSAGDASGRLEYNVPAHKITGRVRFDVSSGSADGLDFWIGVGAGIVSAAGDVQVSITGEGAATGSFEGTGPVVEALVYFDVELSPGISFYPEAGLRYARVGGVKVDGTRVFNADGDEYSLDYSGAFITIGLKLGGRPSTEQP